MSVGRWCAAMTAVSGGRPDGWAATGAPGPISIHAERLVRAGRPCRFISGAMQFQRIPRAYRRGRLRKARAMGPNAIETYVSWDAVSLDATSSISVGATTWP